MADSPTRPKLYASADSFLDPVLSNTWLAVATSDDVAVGEMVPVTLMGVDLVLWRDTGGAVHAWEDFCVHRGVKLSLGHVADDKVVCPYHAWNYDGSGRCTVIPAHPDLRPPERARANVLAATEAYGLVWTSLGAPSGAPPAIVCWDDPVFSTKALCGPYVFEASAQRAVENFIDPSHLGVVHDGILGDKEWLRMRPYEVQETDDGLYAPGHGGPRARPGHRHRELPAPRVAAARPPGRAPRGLRPRRCGLPQLAQEARRRLRHRCHAVVRPERRLSSSGRLRLRPPGSGPGSA